MSKSVLARVAGVFDASNFAFGVNPSIAPARISSSPGGTGAQTITLYAYNITLADGTAFNPFATNAPLLVGLGSNQETVTPSAVSQNSDGTISITATFANAHGRGDLVQSGSAGLQEAINAANSAGGGTVTIDQAWVVFGGTETILLAAAPYAGVTVADNRGGAHQFLAKNQAGTGLGYSGNALIGAPFQELTASGAISPHASGNYLITKAGVAALTLAAPTAGTDDGKIIAVMSTTADAHTITATGLLNTGSASVNVATFAAYAGANVVLRARNATWDVLTQIGITFS